MNSNLGGITKTLKTIIILLMSLISVDAQAQDPSQLLALQDSDANVRMTAFYALAPIGFGGSDQLKLAVISLLLKENSNNALTSPDVPDEGEAYGQYYSDLTATVADLRDARSISALVGAMNTGATAMNAVAQFGVNALDQVIAELSNADFTKRAAAGMTIGKMIDANLVNDPSSQTKIRGAFEQLSLDPDYFVGLTGIQGLLKVFKIQTSEIPNRVVIDIKPGDPLSGINLKSNGLIPVAVLGTPSFNARSIDPATIKFGPGQTRPAQQPHFDDVNGDTLPDLVVTFDTKASGITCSDTASFLFAQTTMGQLITGSDSFLVTGCK